MKKKIIIIGGGPAGIMAAGRAASSGGEVLLLEKMQECGRKLSITGNGRGNITNSAGFDEFTRHFGPNGKFLRPSFKQFFSDDLISFLCELGIACMTEDDGRTFPQTQRAADVRDALVQWLRRCGVTTITDTCAERIITTEGTVSGVDTTSTDAGMNRTGHFPADAVIIATGGASYPHTGSSGDGYRLAQSVGHSLVPIRPAVVPLLAEKSLVSRLQGVTLPDVSVRVLVDGKKAAQKAGSLLFTDSGVSGPVILSISRYAVDALIEGKTAALSIDILPDHDDMALDRELISLFDTHGKQLFRSLLKRFVTSKMEPVFLDILHIDPHKRSHQITAEERKRFRTLLKGFTIPIQGFSPLEKAFVTAGGVPLPEVSPSTMESKLVKGLYFAGEVLDIDADTGGFNLQAAFSTGWVAGIHAAKR